MEESDLGKLPIKVSKSMQQKIILIGSKYMVAYF